MGGDPQFEKNPKKHKKKPKPNTNAIYPPFELLASKRYILRCSSGFLSTISTKTIVVESLAGVRAFRPDRTIDLCQSPAHNQPPFFETAVRGEDFSLLCLTFAVGCSRCLDLYVMNCC